MQIVYISNRKNLSEETLKYVENLMPFIHESVYICPDAQMDEFKFNSSLKITVIDESSVLGKHEQLFRDSKDHQFRNWLLRSSFPYLEAIEDEFLMSDDDHRPLMEISPNFYKQSNKYNGYYFYDLKNWASKDTDYDRGQHNTFRILAREGYPTLSYSCHMPQIINKKILEEVGNKFEGTFRDRCPIDEWSIYFNYAFAEYPDLFNPASPFKTMCWPVLPSDWQYDIRPDGFYFENFCPFLYRNGRVFNGIPTSFNPLQYRKINSKKMERRARLQDAYENGVVSMAGKLFLFLRSLVARYPWVRRLTNELISPGIRTGVVDFFLRTGFHVGDRKNGR